MADKGKDKKSMDLTDEEMLSLTGIGVESLMIDKYITQLRGQDSELFEILRNVLSISGVSTAAASDLADGIEHIARAYKALNDMSEDKRMVVMALNTFLAIVTRCTVDPATCQSLMNTSVEMHKASAKSLKAAVVFTVMKNFRDTRKGR